jgi:SHS2 domain-containing protein
MNSKFDDFELVEHTADIGLKIYGKDKRELFINAARGMFFLITGSVVSSVRDKPKKYFTVESSASNLEDLIISWLNDILYIYDTEFVIFYEYTINSMTEKRIKARVAAIEIEGSPYQIIKEIKAVTYHDLHVYQNKDGRWEANIVFDI